MPNAGLLALLSAGNFVIGIGAFIVIGLLPLMASDLGVSAAQAGWVMTAYALSYAILSPICVAVTGDMGRRRVVTFGMALFGIGALGVALAPDLLTVSVARGVAAVGAGMFSPVAAAIAAGVTTPERRGRALSAVFLGLTLAQVLGVPVGNWVAYAIGWRWSLGAVACLAFPFALVLWLRVPAGLRFAPNRIADLRAAIASPRLVFAILFTSSFIASGYIVFTYIAELLIQTMGFSGQGVALTLLFSGVGAVCGTVIGGRLTDRIGATQTLVLQCLIHITLLPVFSTLPQPVWVVAGAVFLWSASVTGFVAAQQVRLIGLAGERTTVALSLNAAGIYIGAALGSAIGGLVLSKLGLTALGLCGGVAAFGALGHLLWSERMNNLARQAGV